MKTNWRDFGIGMASGVALCFVLYFGWGLIHPRRPEPTNVVAASNNVGMDENALIAANAERSNNNAMNPPPQLRPEPRVEPITEPVAEPEPEPPVVRPRPRPRPEPEDIPDDVVPDDDYGGKPQD